MARKGRPKLKSTDMWDRQKLLDLEKLHQTDEDRQAYERYLEIYAKEPKKPIGQRAASEAYKSVPHAIDAPHAGNEENLINQIFKSTEMKELLIKCDIIDVLDMVAESREALALAKRFPIIGDILKAIKATHKKERNILRRIEFIKRWKKEGKEGEGPAWWILYEAEKNPNGQIAKKLSECKIKDSKCLNPTITMQDMDVLFTILADAEYDIFAYKPTKKELLAVIRGEARKPLRIKNTRFWAYFLEGLYSKKRIGGNWQNAYSEAKAFENSGGRILNRNDLSRGLSKAKEDKKTLNDKPVTNYRFDENTDMTASQRKKHHFYKDMDEALSSL